MRKIYFLLMVLGIANAGWGQVTIAVQDFDAGTSMTFSNTNGSTQTGSSAAGDRPATSTFYSNATTAWKATNETSTLTFSNVTGLASYTSKFFEFRLASWSIGSTGNGADAGDIVTVAVSLDGGTTYSNEVRVLGNSNAYWHYSTGTGIASVTYDGNNAPTDFAPAAGGNRTTDGYSTVRVSIGDPTTQARLRITMLNNSANEYWTIDEVKLIGTSAGTPDITLSSPNPAVTAGNIAQGSTNNPVYRFDLAVTTATATLTGVTVTTAGTYVASDLTNLKCWYSADATFNAGSDVLLSTKTTGLAAGAQVFPSFTNQNISSGSTGYIFITADIACAAVLSNTISVNAITTADITFSSGNKSGTAFAGDVQTVVSGSPNNVTGAGATNGNTVSSVSWTNPTGCFDEVMIVAASGTNNSGTPAGDGTAYTANLAFGSGTALGNGFVVYKGSTSPQVVNTLTNGTTYYFKLFTRLGTNWSAGVEVSATPTAPVVVTYTWIGGNSAWTTAANWSPTRTTPDITDILQFNDGTTVTVTAVPAQTIGKLLVTGNTAVTLQAGAANTVTIAGGTGTDLDVAAGSSLNSNGANALTITLASGATGVIAGNMTFTTAAHKLDAADASGITFSSPSVFTQGTGCTGNVFTNAGTASAIVFASGSTFIHEAGSNPFALTAPASKVIFQSGSLYKMQQNAALSLSGRTYANLEINLATFSQNQTGAMVLTVDNIIITDGTLGLNLTAGVNIKGNISVATGESLSFAPGSAATITFNGTSNQSITNNGTLTFGTNASVLIFKSSGNVILNTNAQLNNLTISASNTLDLNGQTLSITGSMTNGGTLLTNLGTVDFTGSSGTQTLTSGGTGAGKTFHILNHTGAGTLQLVTNNLRVINAFNNNAGPFDGNGLNVLLEGDLSANGTYTPGAGSLNFNGTAGQNWSGAGANNYGDVVINKSSGNVSLNSNVQVSNLTLTSGKVVLGSNNLTVTTAASGGSATSYVVTDGSGKLTVNNIGASSKLLPIGNSTYNPLTIANGSGHNWSAKVTDALVNVLAPYNTDKAVIRTWNITPSVNPPSAGADLTFQYDDGDPSQLGASFNTAEAVQLWHYGVAWIAASGAISPTGTAGGIRTITKTGWSQYSDFAIANISGPLPVSLASFSGYKDGSRNQLRWTTATEINNLGFDVQRSTDGINYVSIGFVNSLALNGNSSDAIQYSFTDNAPAGTRQYYRLQQTDIGGQHKLSNVVLIRGSKPSGLQLETMFPNPARNTVNLLLAAPGKDKVTIVVSNMTGQALMQKVVSVETGSNTIPLDISLLQSGSYVVRVICSDGCEATGRFVKQ